MRESDITICGHGSGTPSTKNLRTYCEYRYGQIADNGKRKELVEVRRLKALTDYDRNKFHELYKAIIGRNTYSQTLRQYVYVPYKDGDYYSDCSSSGCATFKLCGHGVSLLNTAGIHSSSLFETVNVTIKDGHVTDPEKLRVGDCLMFRGNDPNRPLQIGHVEYVYEINSEREEIALETAELTITAAALNIRTEPSTSGGIIDTLKEGETVAASTRCEGWFKTVAGWVSGKYVKGWIKEHGRWWYTDGGKYPAHCAKDIDGKEYHFDKDGWLITADWIDDDGAVIH